MPLGARIGLTFVMLLLSPIVGWIFRAMFLRHPFGRRIASYLPWDQFLQLMETGIRWLSRVTRFYVLARWLHGRPWRKGAQWVRGNILRNRTMTEEEAAA